MTHENTHPKFSGFSCVMSIYAGATKNLLKRVELHGKGKGAVFTKKYRMKYLVYYEKFKNADDAFKRGKQIKNWRKEWKWNLVKKVNPDFLDLRDELT